MGENDSLVINFANHKVKVKVHLTQQLQKNICGITLIF